MTDKFMLANGEIIRPNGEVIELSPTEAVILSGLWKHRGYYISRQRQAVWVWGQADSWPDAWDNVLAVHHHHMRRKIAYCSFTIENKTNYGDQFRGDLTVDADDARPCDTERA